MKMVCTWDSFDISTFDRRAGASDVNSSRFPLRWGASRVSDYSHLENVVVLTWRSDEHRPEEGPPLRFSCSATLPVLHHLPSASGAPDRQGGDIHTCHQLQEMFVTHWVPSGTTSIPIEQLALTMNTFYSTRGSLPLYPQCLPV